MSRPDKTDDSVNRPADSEQQERYLPGSSIDMPPVTDRILGLMINPTSRRNRKHLDQIIQNRR